MLLPQNTFIKPRVTINPHKSVPKKFICHDDWFIKGYGDTHFEAYCDWRSKEQTRTRIPRKFRWNLNDCKNWFNEGCWMMRSYIGYPEGSKQYWGYDPITDEIILRG